VTPGADLVRLPLRTEQRLEADLRIRLTAPGSKATFDSERGHGDTPGEKGADGGRPGRADEIDGRVVQGAPPTPGGVDERQV
jgi:hypothetical protein